MILPDLLSWQISQDPETRDEYLERFAGISCAMRYSSVEEWLEQGYAMARPERHYRYRPETKLMGFPMGVGGGL